MGDAPVRYFGSAKVTRRDDLCECTPEEMDKRRRKFDGHIWEMLKSPVVRENLRKINREKYGIEG